MPAVDGAVRLIDSALVPEELSLETESVPTSVSLEVMVESEER